MPATYDSSFYADLIRSTIAEHGWFVQKVAAGAHRPRWPQFAYTVGLTAMGHPEILCHGLPLHTAHRLLNLIGDRVRSGATFHSGTLTRLLTDDSVALAFIAVDDADDLACAGLIYDSFSALQLVWPDEGGLFPWNTGNSVNPEQQPLRGSVPVEFR